METNDRDFIDQFSGELSKCVVPILFRDLLHKNVHLYQNLEQIFGLDLHYLPKVVIQIQQHTFSNDDLVTHGTSFQSQQTKVRLQTQGLVFLDFLIFLVNFLQTPCLDEQTLRQLAHLDIRHSLQSLGFHPVPHHRVLLVQTTVHHFGSFHKEADTGFRSLQTHFVVSDPIGLTSQVGIQTVDGQGLASDYFCTGRPDFLALFFIHIEPSHCEAVPFVLVQSSDLDHTADLMTHPGVL